MPIIGSKNSLNPESNPFHIPSEAQMFAMRDEERKLKNEARKYQFDFID